MDYLYLLYPMKVSFPISELGLGWEDSSHRIIHLRVLRNLPPLPLIDHYSSPPLSKDLTSFYARNQPPLLKIDLHISSRYVKGKRQAQAIDY